MCATRFPWLLTHDRVSWSIHYKSRYRIAGNFDGGNFDVFDAFQPDCQNLTCQIFKAIQWFGKRQWPFIKIFPIKYLKSQHPSKFPPVKISLYTVLYGTAHVQVYKLTRVTRRTLRNFVCSSCVGLVLQKEYTAHEQLLMSWKYSRVTPVVQLTRE